MKPIEELQKYLLYDKHTGIFYRKISSGGRKAGASAGCKVPRKRNEYIVISLNSQLYYAHRLAWLYVHGEWPNQIDHIDGDGLNNRVDNLRDVTNSENCKNTRLSILNTSGVTGVYRNKLLSKWETRIGKTGSDYVGIFDEIWDAICARKSAENKHGYHVNHGRSR